MRTLLSVLLTAGCTPALAALNIFACTPEWGALAKELAGDRARIFVATTAQQDPHRIEARPSLLARARTADLVVCTGADLEAGWLPLLQTGAGNPRIQAGQPGYFEAAAAVTLIERPASLDRAHGDVHAAGNPHLHLHPRNVAAVAAALAQRMAELDPKEALHYRARADGFLRRWREATARWEAHGARLRGTAVIVHHRDLAYLVAWLGLREAGALEPRPGIAPSAAHLSELIALTKREPVKAIVRSAYSDARPAEWLSAQTGIPAVVLPYTVGGTPAARDLFGLFDDTLARLLAVAG
ncbi:MAG TPA: zinc ABC transporter substrate-binding protein [Burkholderiales bacterium]|nr:zinc ABC transporter substrate-binding protein [Burkholderiales bacterium]